MLELLKKRRSIRKYTNQPVEKEKLNQIIKAALLSPTSKNSRPWEFMVITNKETLKELSYAKETGGSFLKDAPLAIVIIGDPQKSAVWVEDTSIAATIIHLMAEDLGLGSCWIQIRNRNHSPDKTSNQFIKELLNIPEDKEVEAIISIGYPDEVKAPQDEEKLLFDRVYYEKYGDKV